MALRFLLALMLCTCCLALHAQQDANMQTYRNKERGFSIRYPEAWNAKDKVESPTVLLIQSPIENFNNDFREEMELRYLTDHQGKRVSFSEWIEQMRVGHEDFAEVVRGRGKIGSNHADWIVFTMHHWGYDVRCLAYCFRAEGGSYILLCTSVGQDYERHEHLFREVAESFKLR